MKIAILGASPSKQLAPFNEPDWLIWTCSPGTVGVPRVDFHFEIHSLATIAQCGEQYEEYLREVPVYMQECYPQFPRSVRYPKEDALAEFGTHYFTSSIAWMMAKAILDNAQTIGLWGVDMASDGEYISQRSGCMWFIDAAKARGIEIVLPENSGLLKPSRLYGYDD